MKSVIFEENAMEQELLDKLLECTSNNDGYTTSNCLLKASIGNLFIKN